MNASDFAVNTLNETHAALMQALDGLTQEELMRQPQPEANSIAFTLWHIVRVEDWFFHYLFQRVPQIWEAEKWPEKLNLPDDPKVTGFGYSIEQVASFPAVQLQDLLAYGEAVRASSLDYIRNVDHAKFDEIVKSRLFGEVSIGALMGHVFVEIAEHIGQIGYIRGLMKAQGK